jgi:glycerol-3-phosphate dehydrogenase
MFPKAKLTAGNIHYAFAGVRPLPYSESKNLGAVTRRHILHEHSDEGATHMISVIGGKLTTAASLARECARKIGLKVKEPQTIAFGSGPEFDPLLDDSILEVARIGAISEESARSMLEWHGPRAADIARTALVSAELRAPICPHTPHVVAEAVEAYRKEFAVSLGDVLLRRVPVALGPCWSEACSREAAVRIGTVMGWSERTTATNLEAFEIERTAFLRPVAKAEKPVEANAD